MVDVVAAYGEAFSAYQRNLAGFTIYSVLASLLSATVFIASILVLVAAGLLSAGNASAFASGGLSLATAGISLTVALVIIGGLLLSWIVSGINGAYFETVNFLLTGRSQTLVGFLGAIPRRATPFFATGIIIAIAMFAPPLVLFAAAGAVGLSGMQIVYIALMVLGAAYAAVIALLCIFVFPGMVADGRRPVEAMAYSLKLCSRNFIGVIIYALILALLFIPALIPVVNMLYVPLFLTPISAASLLSLYRRAR